MDLKKYRKQISIFMFFVCLMYAGYHMFQIKGLTESNMISNYDDYTQSTDDVFNEEVVTIYPDDWVKAVWHLLEIIISLFIGGLIYAKNNHYFK